MPWKPDLTRFLLAGFALAAAKSAATADASSAGSASFKIDSIFSRFTKSTPGCAIGVEHAGQSAIMRAYGSADLEHSVPNTIDTIFEAASVSKQFTAATVLLLVEDGRLSMNDDIRKFIPELPDYGYHITIGELLGQTSGLRDWGTLESYAGWEGDDRTYELADVLRVAARQKALNYAPGAAWSYTNTGYDILALIIQRVSGKSLPALSRERIFLPLGMTHSSWRENFRRVVPDRAIGYQPTSDGYEQDMPFENVYGDRGLLTSVGDLLIWNRALTEGRLGAFVTSELQRATVLNDGTRTQYARGLYLVSYRGIPEVSHAGGTAGYSAWLGRYPGHALSIAVLCNVAFGSAKPDALAHEVADNYLPAGSPPDTGAATVQRNLKAWAGWYVDDRWGRPLDLVENGDQVQSGFSNSRLEVAVGGGYRFGSWNVTLLPDGRIQTADTGNAGTLTTYRRAMSYAPSAAQLGEIAGHYQSSEVGAKYVVKAEVDGVRLTVEDRPGESWVFKPAYADAFYLPEYAFLIRIVRGPTGNVIALRLSSDRVWDLWVDRVK